MDDICRGIVFYTRSFNFVVRVVPVPVVVRSVRRLVSDGQWLDGLNRSGFAVDCLLANAFIVSDAVASGEYIVDKRTILG